MIKIYSQKELQRLLDRASKKRKELFKIPIDELKDLINELKDLVDNIYSLSDLIERKITKIEEIIDEKELDEDFDLCDDDED